MTAEMFDWPKLIIKAIKIILVAAAGILLYLWLTVKALVIPSFEIAQIAIIIVWIVIIGIIIAILTIIIYIILRLILKDDKYDYDKLNLYAIIIATVIIIVVFLLLLMF